MQLSVHLRNRAAQRLGDVGGEARRDVSPTYAARVRRHDVSTGSRRRSLEEVCDELGGRDIGPATGLEGEVFAAALEFHAGKDVVSGEVRREHVGEKPRVGVRPGTVREAHAVRDDATGLAGGGNDVAARAHAEREGAAVVIEVSDKLVGGGTQGRVPCKRAILGSVNHRLEVLYADAHRERLPFERDVAISKQFEHVTSGVATRDYKVVDGNPLLNEKSRFAAGAPA
jgi:hypothetical protein